MPRPRRSAALVVHGVHGWANRLALSHRPPTRRPRRSRRSRPQRWWMTWGAAGGQAGWARERRSLRGPAAPRGGRGSALWCGGWARTGPRHLSHSRKSQTDLGLDLPAANASLLLDKRLAMATPRRRTSVVGGMAPPPNMAAMGQMPAMGGRRQSAVGGGGRRASAVAPGMAGGMMAASGEAATGPILPRTGAMKRGVMNDLQWIIVDIAQYSFS